MKTKKILSISILCAAVLASQSYAMEGSRSKNELETLLKQVADLQIEKNTAQRQAEISQIKRHEDYDKIRNLQIIKIDKQKILSRLKGDLEILDKGITNQKKMLAISEEYFDARRTEKLKKEERYQDALKNNELTDTVIKILAESAGVEDEIRQLNDTWEDDIMAAFKKSKYDTEQVRFGPDYKPGRYITSKEITINKNLSKDIENLKKKLHQDLDSLKEQGI